MDLRPKDVREATFSGTRYVYDRREVEDYLEQLAATVEAYEEERVASRRRVAKLEIALDVAKEASAQPGEAAEKTDVEIGAQWRQGMEQELAAVDVLAIANEEARLAVALAEEHVAVDLTAAEDERLVAIKILDSDLRAMRADAMRDAEGTVADARIEGDRAIEVARREAAQMKDLAQREVRSMERRVRQIRSSLRDLEVRFKNLTANTQAEFAMLGDLIDLDSRTVEEVTGANRRASGFDEDHTAPGFYERRLAGLRSRIEASRVDQEDPDEPAGS